MKGADVLVQGLWGPSRLCRSVCSAPLLASSSDMIVMVFVCLYLTLCWLPPILWDLGTASCASVGILTAKPTSAVWLPEYVTLHTCMSFPFVVG